MGKKAQNKKAKSNDLSSESWNALKDFLGFVILSTAVFLLICLISYDPQDPSFNTTAFDYNTAIENYGGIIGSHIADLMMQFFGYASFLFPLGLVELVRTLVFRKTWTASSVKSAGLLLLVVFSAMGFALIESNSQTLPRWGGATGFYVKKISLLYLGLPGSILLWLSMGVISISMIFSLSLQSFFHAFPAMFVAMGKALKALSAAVGNVLSVAGQRIQRSLQKEEKQIQQSFNEIKSEFKNVVPIKSVRPKGKQDEGPKEVLSELPPIVVKSNQSDSDLFEVPEKNLDIQDDAQDKKTSNYELPGEELLYAAENQEIEIDKDQLLEDASILESKLRDFGVEGKVVEVQPGPVVTMYEFEPAAGVKVSQITRLDDDLTMALSALSVRISLVPGKSVVGIEVANKNRQIVYLKDVISHSAFQTSSSKLTFALGKDISGNSFVSDLRKMPHLLVAGATGSGKSVAINSMILSILYKATPEEVRMILVDPKMLELSLYDDIPHLLLPVVTDPRKASAALRWAVKEMERRYRLMADLGVRNLEGYNAKVLKHLQDQQKNDQPDLPETENKENEHTGKLPYLVIVIDELADLMMVSSREVEEYIIRLAQMARASGIHLLLATQRPSVDVITGVIKANMPSRISFQVSSKIDSRTILDSNGAEQLLGAGDMLYLPPGTSRIIRLHGAFVTDQEVEKVANFWKAQGDPEYHEEILATAEEDENSIDGGSGGEDDKLYRQSLELVRERGVASISYIQRRLRIGYNRAARLVERMEEDGFLAPGEVGKPREIIASKLP